MMIQGPRGSELRTALQGLPWIPHCNLHLWKKDHNAKEFLESHRNTQVWISAFRALASLRGIMVVLLIGP